MPLQIMPLINLKIFAFFKDKKINDFSINKSVRSSNEFYLMHSNGPLDSLYTLSGSSARDFFEYTIGN